MEYRNGKAEARMILETYECCEEFVWQNSEYDDITVVYVLPTGTY
jgi:hypothetical protein